MSSPAPQAGARFRLIAPSGHIARDNLVTGLAACEALEIPIDAPADLGEGRTAYLAGSDRARAERLVAAVEARPRGLWMARGGYGAIRTLRALDAHGGGAALDALPPVPLWGFSDGTALLARWASRGWPAWHAPPLSQLERLDAPSVARLRAVVHAGHVAPFEGLSTIVAGDVTAPLVGGNLCVLASLTGTPFAADLTGGILLLEDVGERAYQVDRLVTQLLFSGALDGIAGLVLGDFTQISERQQEIIDAFFDDLAAELGVPAARGLPIGHEQRNAPLPFGRATGWTARLTATEDAGATLAFVREGA